MGSPLRGQIDKLSFRRLVCGDWRTPAKNYNAFIVFWPPDFGSAHPDTELCQKVWTEVYFVKTTRDGTRKGTQENGLHELSTVCKNFGRFFERIALAGRNI